MKHAYLFVQEPSKDVDGVRILKNLPKYSIHGKKLDGLDHLHKTLCTYSTRQLMPDTTHRQVWSGW